MPIGAEDHCDAVANLLGITGGVTSSRSRQCREGLLLLARSTQVCCSIISLRLLIHGAPQPAACARMEDMMERVGYRARLMTPTRAAFGWRRPARRDRQCFDRQTRMVICHKPTSALEAFSAVADPERRDLGLTLSAGPLSGRRMYLGCFAGKLTPFVCSEYPSVPTPRRCSRRP